MKNLILITLLFVAFVSATTAQTAAVANDATKLRGTPSLSAEVVETPATGTPLEIIKGEGGWFLVQSPKFVGWVQSGAVQIDAGFVGDKITKIFYTNNCREVSQIRRGDLVYFKDEAEAADGGFIRARWCTSIAEVASSGEKPEPARTIEGYPAQSGSDGSVQVKGYYRKDGTYVKPHTRSAPRRKH